MPMQFDPPLLLAAAGALAALGLRQASRAPDTGSRRQWMRACGWGGMIATVIIAAARLGPVKGVVTAMFMMSIGAMGVVAAGLTVRPAQAPRHSHTGSGRARPAPRRVILVKAADIALVAFAAFCFAALCGAFYDLTGLGGGSTRLIAAWIMIPTLWAGFVAWALADTRMLRVHRAVGAATLVIAAGFMIRRMA